MAHKWIIKRVKEDPIYCSETVAQQVLAAWKGGVGVISFPGVPGISGSSITAVEETLESDNVYELLGTGENIKPAPMFNPNGEVMTNWYKMNVGAQEWEKNFSRMPNYYKLVDQDRAIWVAVRLPEYTGMTSRGREWEPCTEGETQTLDRQHA